MSIIKFEIDGQTVDADDVSWYCYAPCGCCCGVTMLTRANGLLVSEDDVWREWEPNPTNRKRDRAAGFTFRLNLRSKVRELLTMPGDCPHTPRWGVATTELPDGHRWAANNQRSTMRDRKHIVATEHTVDTPKKGEPFPEWTGVKHESLCGRSEMRWWGDQFSVSDLPECTRCVQAAKKVTA